MLSNNGTVGVSFGALGFELGVAAQRRTTANTLKKKQSLKVKTAMTNSKPVFVLFDARRREGQNCY